MKSISMFFFNFNTVLGNIKIYMSLQITISYIIMPIFTTCFNCSKLHTFP